MKLRLNYSTKFRRYFIEKKLWLWGWEHIKGPYKNPTDYDGLPKSSDFDGGLYYTNKEFAIESMEKLLNKDKCDKIISKNFETVMMEN